MDLFLKHYPLEYVSELELIPRTLGQVMRVMPPNSLLNNAHYIISVLEQLCNVGELFELMQMLYISPTRNALPARKWFPQYINDKFKAVVYRGFLHETEALTTHSWLIGTESQDPLFSLSYAPGLKSKIWKMPVVAQVLKWFETTHDIGLIHYKTSADITAIHRETLNSVMADPRGNFKVWIKSLPLITPPPKVLIQPDSLEGTRLLAITPVDATNTTSPFSEFFAFAEVPHIDCQTKEESLVHILINGKSNGIQTHSHNALTQFFFYIIFNWLVSNGCVILDITGTKGNILTFPSYTAPIVYDVASTVPLRVTHNIEGYISRIVADSTGTYWTRNIGDYFIHPFPMLANSGEYKGSVNNQKYTSVEYFINRRLMVVWRQTTTYIKNGNVAAPVADNHPPMYTFTASTPLQLRETYMDTTFTALPGYYLSDFLKYDIVSALDSDEDKDTNIPELYNFWFKPAAKTKPVNDTIPIKWSLIQSPIDVPLFIHNEHVSNSPQKSIVKFKLALGTIMIHKLNTANTAINREDQIIEIRFQIIVLLLDPKPVEAAPAEEVEGTSCFRTGLLSSHLKRIVPYVFGTPEVKPKCGNNVQKLIIKGQEEKLTKILNSGLLLPGFGRMYSDFAVNFDDAPLTKFFSPSPVVELL